MKQELILSSINQYMVGFVHSLRIQSDLNPKKKVYPFSGDGVFFVPDCIALHMQVSQLWPKPLTEMTVVKLSYINLS